MCSRDTFHYNQLNYNIIDSLNYILFDFNIIAIDISSLN